MKKVLLLGFILLGRIAYAQTITVAGTVTDPKGTPIPFAFVSDSQHPYATYTDQNGQFSLMADPASNLLVSAKSHVENKVKIDNPTSMKIVLADGESKKPEKEKMSSENFFSPDDNRVDHAFSINKIGSSDVGVHGSRYLFPDWVHGYAISPQDSIKQNDDYLFNYDKQGGNLLFTRNRTSAMIVVRTEVKTFTLYDENAIAVTFENVPAINPKHYLQVLASGPKYKIYKDITVQFSRADFVTNGITSSGHNYDEYKDINTYYVVKAGGAPQKLELKSKAMKTAFAADADKLKKFMADNEDGEIDDNYLKALGEAMNK